MKTKTFHDIWLRGLRAEAEITRVELAEQLGLDNLAQLEAFEEGAARIPSFLYPGFARTFGMSVRDFERLCVIHEERRCAA